MMESLKSLDSFPKAFDDFRIKTTSGAIVSILTVIIMIVLFFSEMSYFYKPVSFEYEEIFKLIY